MDLHILDTDILTLFQLGHSTVMSRVFARQATEIATTVISVEEQLGGWYTRLRRAKKPDELARVYQLLATNVEALSRFRILSFSESSIARYEQLKRDKLNVNKKDLRIAAIGLELNATIVTRNLADFGRVPGLIVEDWSV